MSWQKLIPPGFRTALAAACILVLSGASDNDWEKEIDLELVLAVDVSMSMNPEEISLQRQGYLDAFSDRTVVDAILTTGSGRVAVTYMEWAGKEHVRFAVPWMLIDSHESAARFVEALKGDTPTRVDRTSISNALAQAGAAFDANDWHGLRRIIDISGDGPNNEGERLPRIRDELVASGITINGLAVMVEGAPLGMGIDNLDEYYRQCVTGGSGSFVLSVRNWAHFSRALELKLLQEITGTSVPGGQWPEYDWMLQPVPAQHVPQSRYTFAKDRPVDCEIGERIWRRFMETFGMQ